MVSDFDVMFSYNLLLNMQHVPLLDAFDVEVSCVIFYFAVSLWLWTEDKDCIEKKKSESKCNYKCFVFWVGIWYGEVVNFCDSNSRFKGCCTLFQCNVKILIDWDGPLFMFICQQIKASVDSWTAPFFQLIYIFMGSYNTGLEHINVSAIGCL